MQRLGPDHFAEGEDHLGAEDVALVGEGQAPGGDVVDQLATELRAEFDGPSQPADGEADGT